MRKIIINIIPALFVLTIAQLCIVGKISISIGIIILGLFLVMSLILLIIGFKNKDYALMFIFPIAIISVLFFKFITHNQYNENMARCESVFKKLDNYDKNRGKFPNDLSEAYSKDEQVPTVRLGFSRSNFEYTTVAGNKFYRLSMPVGYGTKQTWDSSFHSWDYQD